MLAAFRQTFFATWARRPRRPSEHRFLPTVEQLEDRLAPASDSGTAYQREFVQQPSSPVIVGQTIQPALTVEVVDSSGKLVTTDTSEIYLGPLDLNAPALQGTTTVAAVGGIATFADLSFDQPWSNYSLLAYDHSEAVFSAQSVPFDVVGSIATHLAFLQQPNNTVAGQTVTPAITVAVEDASGQVVTTDRSTVTLGLNTNGNSGALNGTLSVAASGGIAAFSGLSIDQAGSGYTLQAADNTLTPATSNAFNVTTPLTVSAASLSAVEGQSFRGALGSVSGGTGPYSVSINYGDNTPPQTLTVASAGPIIGSHTFAEEGTFPVQVRVTDAAGKTVRPPTVTAPVADAALTASGESITYTVGQAFNGTVATFTDANPHAALDDFFARIDWHDGTPISAATIQALAQGGFAVVGQHTYQQGGEHPITVALADKGGAQAKATGAAADDERAARRQALLDKLGQIFTNLGSAGKPLPLADYPAFLLGVFKGFVYEGAGGDLKLLKDLVELEARLKNPLLFKQNLKDAEALLLKAIKAGKTLNEIQGIVLKQLDTRARAIYDLLNAALRGDKSATRTALDKIGDQDLTALELATEITLGLSDQLAKLKPEDKGKVVGFIYYQVAQEILIAMFTAGEGNALKAGATATKIIKALESVGIKGEKVVVAVERAINYAIAFGRHFGRLPEYARSATTVLRRSGQLPTREFLEALLRLRTETFANKAAARAALARVMEKELGRALKPEELKALDRAAAQLFKERKPTKPPIPPHNNGGVLNNANFAQKTYSPRFSKEGKFAGRTVADVAADLRAGRLSPKDVPIEYIVRDGNTLILNTRSAEALIQAGIPRSQWYVKNLTGNAEAELRLTNQLKRNKLTSKGTPTVRPSGGNQ